MKPTGTRIIRTPRLLLRPPQHGDAEALVRIRSLAMPLADAKKAVAAMVQEAAKPFAFHWVITMEGEVVGRIKGWDVNPYNGNLQLGYDIAPDHRGNGLMTEAVTAVLQYLFDSAEANRVWCSVREGNVASQRVCLKCGMQPEGVLRQHYACQHGGYDDVHLFGILRSEWQSIAERKATNGA